MNGFGRLVEKEIPRLRRYAVVLTRNMSPADDLVLDTLVRAIAKQRYGQCGTNLRAWLFTIIHNQNVHTQKANRESYEAKYFSRSTAAQVNPTSSTGAHSAVLASDGPR
jgi:DNA-directed RNA polymerase specialized sigma24 family protein